MKKINKTIVEPNKGSISKKIGRYAVIVVLYIAIVSTLAFIMSTITLIVNADSINETPDYQYLKTSYYNWDNITWYTENSTFVTGSNDTFSTENEFIDFYSIGKNFVPTDLTGYTISVPSGWSVSSGYYSLTLNGSITFNDYTYRFSSYPNLYLGYSVSNNSFIATSNAIGFIYSSNYKWYLNNTYSFVLQITGGDSSTSSYFIQWLVDNGAIFELTDNTRAIESSDYSFLIQRNNVYNDSLSDNDLFVYDSVLSSDLSFDSIVFEKSNYFLRVGDLNRIGTPMISANTLTGGYNISFEIEGYRKDNQGRITNLSIVTDSRTGVLGYQYLYPSKLELFGNIDNLNNNDMLYIKNIRVLVEFPNNYVDSLNYRYGVDSIEKSSLDYDSAFSSWVNQSSISNIGNDLLSSVNGFLAFELVPGLSLMSILILLVVIPLLIWILRLFLGG